MRLSWTAFRLLAACAALGGCGDDSIENTTDNSTAEGELDGGGTDGGHLDASTPSSTDSGTYADASLKVDASVDAGRGPAAGGALCHLAGNEVAVLGDSYIQLSGDFTRMLQDHARAAKALGENETYVDHALSGASLNGFPAIPPQLDDAIADAKGRGSKGIKLVIMDGGGNDVLVNARYCLDPASVADVEKNADCVKVVNDAMDAAQKLFDHGVEEGVQGVVYFFYPHLPKDSLGGGPNANNILDYSVPLARQLCERQTKAPCYFVDMRPAFNDPMNNGWPKPGLIAWDGIHPTQLGSQVLADEVWKVMQANCLASQ